MSLNRKTLLSVSGTLVAWIVILYLAADAILMKGFIDIEQEDAAHKVKQAAGALSGEIANLEATNSDWAYWDDVYRFIHGDNPDFPKNNLMDETFSGIRLNFMIFLDGAGRIVLEKGFDLIEQRPIPVPDDLRLMALEEPVIRERDEFSGLLGSNEGPVVISAKQILTSHTNGPPGGKLIMGRFLNNAERQRLSETINLPLTFLRPEDLEPSEGLSLGRFPIWHQLPIAVINSNAETISAYGILKDISGKPALVLKTSAPRHIYRQGKLTLLYFLIALILVGGTFIFLILLLLRKLVLSKLILLSNEIRSIGIKGKLSERIAYSGNDELGTLADSMNRMLEKLESSNEALRRSDQKFVKAYRASPDSVLLFRQSDGVILDVNENFIKTLMLDKSEAVGRSIRDLPIWESTSEVSIFLKEISKKGECTNIGADFRAKNGRSIPVLISAKRIEAEGTVCILATARNITDRKKAAEALRESEERYRSLVENTGDGHFVIDCFSGNLIFVNRRFCELFGYGKEECLKLSFTDFFLPENRAEIRERLDALQKRGGSSPDPIPCTAVRKDGARFRVMMSESIVFFKSKTVIQGAIRDVTRQERLEQQLIHARKMEAIGTLAGGIAHDFNNLLMGIQGNVSLLNQSIGSSQSARRELKTIEQCVRSGAALTGQLLDFARDGSFQAKIDDLNELARKTLKMFGRTRKEIAIHEKYHPHPCPVKVDVVQIQQVLLNILVNAWQEMPGGGHLYVETGITRLPDGGISPDLSKDSRFVFLSITDTGAGMDPETCKKIFEPFFTARGIERGTGLGLAAAYGIITKHEGFIRVYSEKNHGATFRIYLPLGESAAESTASPSETLLCGNETILLVDDEEVIIEVGSKMLNRMGYSVLTARNGAEALELLAAEPERVSLVILDMVMPEIGGGELFDRIKRLYPSMRVLLSSGYSRNGEAAEIMNRGCDDFLQKPFTISDLSHKVRGVLERRPGSLLA